MNANTSYAIRGKKGFRTLIDGTNADEYLEYGTNTSDLEGSPHFDFGLKCDDPSLDQCVSHLLQEYRISANPKHFHKEKHAKVLKLILLNLIYCLQVDRLTWLAVSRGARWYSSKRYNPKQISREIAVRLIDWLRSKNYIMTAGGFFDRKLQKGMKSRIVSLDKLVQLFSAYNALKASIELEDENELIILRNNKGELQDYAETNSTRRMRRNVQALNSSLKSVKLTLGGRTYPASRFRRIFNDRTFNVGGRFYDSYFQSIKREDRKNVRINGQSIVEYDYSAIHINLLYAQSKKKCKGDPYSLSDYPKEQYRDVIKLAVQCVLNNRRRTSAIRALAKEVHSDAKMKALFQEKGKVGKLISAIEIRHSPIKRRFYKEVGKKLQYQDSKIAEKVVTRLIALNIPVLPIHDSFVVEAQFGRTLKQIMLDSYKAETGATITVKKK